MPTTPEPRFEVPPEYAEVYERAYRRAYEQGLGVQPQPEAAPGQSRGETPGQPARGRRVAIPRQRGASPLEQPPRRGGARRAGAPPKARTGPGPDLTIHVVPEPEAAPAVETATVRRRRRHRGVPRTGSTWVPLLVLLALVLMLIAGAFVLGRATADGPGSLRAEAPAGLTR